MSAANHARRNSVKLASRNQTERIYSLMAYAFVIGAICGWN